MKMNEAEQAVKAAEAEQLVRELAEGRRTRDPGAKVLPKRQRTAIELRPAKLWHAWVDEERIQNPEFRIQKEAG